MDLFSAIAKSLPAPSPSARKGEGPSQFVPIRNGSAPLWREWNSERATVQGFKTCSWMFSCADRIAKAFATVPWVVKRREGNEWVAQEGHDLELLIEYPNEKMSRNFLHYFQALQILLCGNLLFKKVYLGGRPAELWPLNPAGAMPIASDTEWVSGYALRDKDGRRLPPLPAADVIHAQFADPDNPLWGMSAAKALAIVVETDVESVRWNRSVLRNSAIPPGAFVDPTITTTEQLNETKARLEERYANPENARKPLVLAGGATWLSMANSPAEMDWLNSRRFTVGEICAAFNLLVALFSAEAQTYDNVQGAIKHMWRNPVMALADTFRDAYNLSLIKPADRRTTWITYDISGIEELKEDLGRKIMNHEINVRSGIPINASIDMLELPLEHVDGGDEPLVSAGLVPLADVGTGRPASGDPL